MENLKDKLGDLLGSGKDDVKEKIDAVVSKINGDGNLLTRFKEDPEKTIESLTGIDIPDAIADKVINGVKAILLNDKVDNLVDKAKDLLGVGDDDNK